MIDAVFRQEMPVRRSEGIVALGRLVRAAVQFTNKHPECLS